MFATRSVTIAALALTAAVALAGCTPAASTAPTVGPSGSPSASSAALPANFPVGAWTMTVTPDDLRAAGVTEQGAIAENSGKFVLTFTQEGQWTVVQQAGDPTRWPVFRGRVTPTGDGAFDATTEFPPEYAGDVVRHTWQLNGDALTIRVPDTDDPILKANWEAHAWQRASTS